VCFSAEDFDPRYAVPSLENNASPSKWLAKKNNLAAVHKSLLRYIQSHCSGDIDPIALGIPDFNAIAEKEDEQETVKVGRQALKTTHHKLSQT
jgi:protein HOOK3